jgi:polysaccharide biosynthesis protein PslG
VRRRAAAVAIVVTLWSLGVLAPRADAATVGSRVGVAHAPLLYLSRAGMDRALDRIVALGARWIRVDFPWSVIQRHGPNRFDWSRTDFLVRAANAHGLHVLALLTYSPEWARPPGTSDRHAPDNPDDFARFAGAAARRYGPRGVHHYEIWNEPNLRQFWGREPDVAEYSQLLRRSARLIRRNDRDAFIVSGGLAPALDEAGSISPLWFTIGLYAAQVDGAFDALGMHPYSFPSRATTEASWNLFHIQPRLHRIMTELGDGGKRIWATEIGWPTGTAANAVSEATQADRLVEAIRAWQRYEFSGRIFVYQFRDLGPDRASVFENMGVYRRNTTAKPAVRALRSLLRSTR